MGELTLYPRRRNFAHRLKGLLPCWRLGQCSWRRQTAARIAVPLIFKA